MNDQEDQTRKNNGENKQTRKLTISPSKVTVNLFICIGSNKI